ncbi:MAG TPA: methyltransferase domain-containing protein [Candidatus Limnocylindrales bacterium]|nr:methyltransferase domain-containing protein [Candidatus Limnocylindrales bacterium]
MAKSEHEWGSQQYDQEWVDKDSRRAAEREAQFNAALSWLSVFVSGQSRVMDLGCGPGTLAEKLLGAFPEMQMICSDGSDEMLKLARQRLASYGNRVSYAQADFSADNWTANLPRQLDAVVSARAIHNLRNLKLIGPVYGHIHELLRTGGVFMNIERVNFATPKLRQYFRELQIKTRGRAAKMDGAAPSLAQQFSLLRRAGFADIDCFWRETNTAIVGGFRRD